MACKSKLLPLICVLGKVGAARLTNNTVLTIIQMIQSCVLFRSGEYCPNILGITLG